MTIDEINREISRLEELKQKKERELLSNLKDYVGRYCKSGDLAIGLVYNAEAVLDVKELYFDDDNYQIYNDIESYEPEEVDLITKEEFEEILNGWVSRIKKIYNIDVEK